MEPLAWRLDPIENLLRLRPLTRLIRTTGYRIRERRFLATPAPVVDANGHALRWHDGLVATVAFNRPDMTRWQVHLVKKHLADGPAGKMTVHQMLVLLGGHNLRHNAQIREALAQLQTK